MKRKKVKPQKDKFLREYDRRFKSVSTLIKKYKYKNILGFILNLLDGVTSVERLSRQLQNDHNLTLRLIDQIKDANSKLFNDMPEPAYRRLVDLFSELGFLTSQRLSAIQIALYHNREIPHTKLPSIPIRQSREKKSSRSRTGKKSNGRRKPHASK